MVSCHLYPDEIRNIDKQGRWRLPRLRRHGHDGLGTRRPAVGLYTAIRANPFSNVDLELNVSTDLSGKSVVVTGSGSGIGREIALTLAANGASVTVADLNAEGAAAVAKEITGAGGSAQPVRVNVTDSAQVDSMFEAAAAAYGRVDALGKRRGVRLQLPHR